MKIQSISKMRGRIKVRIPIALLFLFILFFYLQNFTMMSTTLCNLIMAVSGAACFLYEAGNRRNNTTRYMILYTIAMISLSFLCKSVSDNKSIQFIVTIMSYSGIAMALLYEDIKPDVYKKIYYIAVFWYIVRHLLGLANQYAVADEKNQYIFNKGGALSTDIVLLILYLLMAAAYYRKQEKVGYIPVLLGAIPVFLSLKRMGIIIWLLLVFFQLLYDEKKARFKIAKAIPLIVIVMFAAYYLATTIFSSFLQRFIERFAKDGVSISGLADSRLGIWKAYIQNLFHIETFVFGVSFEVEEILRIYRGNAHNVILNCHATVGIFGVMMNLLLSIRAFWGYIKSKYYYLAGLAIIFFLRGMSDYVFWFNWGDIVWLLFIFYPQIYDIKGTRCKYTMGNKGKPDEA